MTDSQIRHLFVYGTLRRAYNHLPLPLRQMRPPHILDTKGRWKSTSTLQNFTLWDVGKYPGIVPGTGDVVIGDVFEVNEDIFDVLDEYESIGAQFEQPYEYRREIVDVDGVKAWVYVYNWRVGSEGMTRVADGDYVKYCASKL